MFDSALAFDRYRLEVVRSWPDSAIKDKLLASIECSLRRNGESRENGMGFAVAPLGTLKPDGLLSIVLDAGNGGVPGASSTDRRPSPFLVPIIANGAPSRYRFGTPEP